MLRCVFGFSYEEPRANTGLSGRDCHEPFGPGAHDSAARSGTLTFRVESVAGLKVITRSDNGLTYALASDVAVEARHSCLAGHGSVAECAKVTL